MKIKNKVVISGIIVALFVTGMVSVPARIDLTGAWHPAGGGGGNPFDQNLNMSCDVDFNSVDVDQNLTFPHGVKISRNGVGGTQYSSSVTIGSSVTTEDASVTIGDGSGNYGSHSFLLGFGSIISNINYNEYVTSVGNQQMVGWNKVSTGAIALGEACIVDGQEAINVGSTSVTDGNYAIAIGSNSQASANEAIAIGHSVTNNGETSIAIGDGFTNNVANIMVTNLPFYAPALHGDGGNLTNVTSNWFNPFNQLLNTTNSPRFANLYVDTKIMHYGDTHTYTYFSNDMIRLYAGGLNMLSLKESTTDEVVVNDLQANIDFRVESDDRNNLFYADATGNYIGINGGQINRMEHKTGAYTLSAGDRFLVCDGIFTVTMLIHHDGQEVIFKNKGTRTITLSGDHGGTIDGAATYLLDHQWDSVTLISDKTNGCWYITAVNP